ncbi:MAG TPA: hypothetical protein VJ548_06460 [Azospira sp.]|nr:hypothetical protein [Azospira sp.]
MTQFRPLPAAGLLLAASLTLPLAAQASCGSSFCVLNTSWDTQGVQSQPGQATLDLRYEYVRQDQLWRGSSHISADQDNTDALEKRTINRNLITSLDYTFNDRWGMSVALPVVSRQHDHIADPTGEATPESWNFSRSGDVRVLGRYRLNGDEQHAEHSAPYGLQFGIKLPTGDYKLANGAGSVAERALQPGTGSTDLIVGAYYTHRPTMSGPSWFAQGLLQSAVATQDQYRPGDQASFSVGVSYPQTEAFSLLFQVNGLVKQRDTGANAEPTLSGGRYLFASPGVSYGLTRDTQIYAFLQAPLYRHVNGIQLTADWSVVSGISLRF